MLIMYTALEGMERAESKANAAASRLARLPFAPQQDTVDLSREAIALLEARNLMQANVNVIKTAEEMEQKLLDVFG